MSRGSTRCTSDFLVDLMRTRKPTLDPLEIATAKAVIRRDSTFLLPSSYQLTPTWATKLEWIDKSFRRLEMPCVFVHTSARWSFVQVFFEFWLSKSPCFLQLLIGMKAKKLSGSR